MAFVQLDLDFRNERILPTVGTHCVDSSHSRVDNVFTRIQAALSLLHYRVDGS